MIYNSIIETIGNTPLVRLNKVNQGIKGEILVKVEYFNPGNSMKDRMAIKMVEDAEKEGILKPGGTIIEGTSGNTGMGLALAAIAKGYKCIFTMADKQSKEKIDILKAVGAEVIVCPTNVSPEDPRSYYSVAKKLNQDIPNSFYPNQYDNLSNSLAHYETTGPEIWQATNGQVDILVAGVGTGGTITGISRYFEQVQNKPLYSVAVEPAESPIIGQTKRGEALTPGPHKIQGIGAGFIPGNLDLELIDRVEAVTNDEAIDMARRLMQEEGILVGISSGAAVVAANRIAELPEFAGKTIVVILPSAAERYLSSVLFQGQFGDEENVQ